MKMDWCQTRKSEQKREKNVSRLTKTVINYVVEFLILLVIPIMTTDPGNVIITFDFKD